MISATDVKNVARNLMTGGMNFADDIEVLRKVLLLNIITAIGIVTLAIMGANTFLTGKRLLGLFDISVALVMLLLFFHRRKSGHTETGILIGGLCACALFIYLFVTGGVENTGHMWFYIFPLFSTFLLGARRGTILNIVSLACALALLVAFRSIPWVVDHDYTFTLRFALSYLVVSLFAFCFEMVGAAIQSKIAAKNEELQEKISVLRTTEEALQKSREELEQNVEERTAELVKAVEHLQQQIAERETAERALLDSHERFATVLEGIAADVYVADIDTYEILFVNRHMRDSLGNDALVGQPCWRALRDLTGPCSECAGFKLLDGEDKPAGLLTWEGVNPLTGRWYVYHARAIPWSRNRMVRLQIATDITDRKLAEKALQKANEELEIRVKERTENIAMINQALRLEIQHREGAQAEALRARDTAEQANRAKSEFLANMSHELRTPLNHIIGFTELVADKRVGELNADQEEYLRDVLESSHHLLSLINDILDLSKVEAGKMELEPSDVNIRVLLESSLVMIKEKSMKHRISLGVDYDGIPEMIRVDERKMKQVMYNLLSNAVKFTPDGGSIRITARKATEDGGMMESGGAPKGNHWIKVSVADTGIGIKPADLERIFAPFEQVDTSTSRRYKGTGLGLSLSKQFVELHDGKIWAESEGEGKGSTFFLIIPV